MLFSFTTLCLHIENWTIIFDLIRAKGANKEVKETETKTNGTVDPEPELDVEPAKKVEDYDDDSMVSNFLGFL